MHHFLNVLVSALPVFLFLVFLILFDSYKLVKPREVLLSIVVGIATAGIAYAVNTHVMLWWDLSFTSTSRYVAPVIEETLKAAFVMYLITRGRIGFMVDAAIIAFGIGAGFSLIENLYYVSVIDGVGFITWVLRGFGTAIMHGGATALFAVVAKSLTDREIGAARSFVQALVLALFIHSLYNHFIFPPVVSALLVMLMIPIVLYLVFERSEQRLRQWLEVGFNTDQELLQIIMAGGVMNSNVGEYFRKLQQRFPGEVVVDMLCLLRIHLELSIRAKGILLMHEAGFPVPHDPEVAERFDEMKSLEKNIGTTGKRALAPFIHTSKRDLWQLYMLDKEA